MVSLKSVNNVMMGSSMGPLALVVRQSPVRKYLVIKYVQRVVIVELYSIQCGSQHD